MTSPYTTQPLDAFMAAQGSVGLALAAVVWFRPPRPALAAWLLLVAIALAVVAPVGGDFLVGIGLGTATASVTSLLEVAGVLAAASSVITLRPSLALAGLCGEAIVWRVSHYVQQADAELAALHLAFFGCLAGLHWAVADRGSVPGDGGPREGEAQKARAVGRLDDVLALAAGTVAGVVVCRVVLHGWTNSGDEWANTFQAALFAKLRAYGSVPRCSEAFRAFWVFQYMGRSFAQYTPGWPLFMAPFVAVRLAWLAGPVSLGLLAVGVGRLGRRAGRCLAPSGTGFLHGEARAAGAFAVIVLLLGAEALLNGASRYPHVFVAATYAWAVEALMAICNGETSGAAQWRAGAVLGAAAAFMLAARPGDGVTLGIGLFLYFIYAAARGRVGWCAAAAATAAVVVIGGVSLVVLRLQLGRWFTTGYSLTKTMYPWLDFKWSVPEPDEYKWGIPLAVGAYCWWPCSPALGLAGIAALRGRGRAMGFVFVASCVPLMCLYTLITLGRGFDLGYGPRYTVPLLVPMAVGSGVVLGRLWAASRVRWSAAPALRLAGPAALAMVAVFGGVARIAPLLYPLTYTDVQAHNRLHEALKPLHLRNAVVFAGAGLNNTDLADLPENLPLELYPDPDVIIAVDRGSESARCVRALYPKRTFYRALAGGRVRIVPF